MRFQFMLLRVALVLSLVCAFYQSRGQTQLILFNKDKVLVRYTYGDDIIYKLKNTSKYKTGLMLGATEFSIIMFNDTVQFKDIDRISLKGHPQRSGLNLLSKALITAGIAYFVIDQFNNVVVQGQKADLEPSVWKPSLIMVASGFALKLLKKRSQRIRFPARLVTAEYGSPFYKSDE